MSRINNYSIQARQAKERFASYDQAMLIAKLNLRHDETYLYTCMFSETYRIHRETGDMSRKTEAGWVDADSFEEVMTLLDLICDSRENRFLAGKWKNTADFGLMFHRNLLEQDREFQDLAGLGQVAQDLAVPDPDLGQAPV